MPRVYRLGGGGLSSECRVEIIGRRSSWPGYAFEKAHIIGTNKTIAVTHMAAGRVPVM
jgi:hypothetical protein